jgi:quercetin dioxygenase-like cupin family protein
VYPKALTSNVFRLCGSCDCLTALIAQEHTRCVSDPVESNPSLYKVVFENERVRVLEYRDKPGERTTPHTHPDSVMVTMSAFDRRLSVGDQVREVSLEPGRAMWLPEQTHAGENIGTSETHVMFVELKEPVAGSGDAALGPQSAES